MELVREVIRKLEPHWPKSTFSSPAAKLFEEKALTNLKKLEKIKVIDDGVQSEFLAGGVSNEFIFEGERLLKLTNEAEIAFYEAINKEPQTPDSIKLLGFTSKYLGTEVRGSKTNLVLQNLLHGNYASSIIDIKIGALTYDEDAGQTKKEKEIKKSKGSTGEKHGFRVTGFTYTFPL